MNSQSQINNARNSAESIFRFPVHILESPAWSREFKILVLKFAIDRLVRLYNSLVDEGARLPVSAVEEEGSSEQSEEEDPSQL